MGPLLIQRPFHPEPDGAAHVYLLHPPGGVAGGDSLHVDCHLAAGAKALFTMPGATKVYRSPDRASRIRTVIDVGAGATCEYLPQETILFDGSSCSIETDVSLAADAIYAGWDFLSLGRPASGENFSYGSVAQRVEIRREGRPVWIERLHLAGGSPLMRAAFAVAGKPVIGTLVYAGPIEEGTAEHIRHAVGETPAGRLFSVSQLEHVVVCRYLGARMSEARSLFGRAWEALREGPMRRRAIAPRIWST